MSRTGKILDEMTLKVANSVKTISDAKAIWVQISAGSTFCSTKSKINDENGSMLGCIC